MRRAALALSAGSVVVLPWTALVRVRGDVASTVWRVATAKLVVEVELRDCSETPSVPVLVDAP